MFGSWKILRKDKNIFKKLYKNLYILKLFNLYIINENKLKDFEKYIKVIY